jgi:hypothetical protein
MSNKIIIANDSVDFVVRNYESVIAISECLEQTKTDLPSWVITKIISELKKQKQKLPEEHSRWIFDEYIDDGGFNIFPNNQYYDAEKEIGVHYGVEGIDWDSLTADYEENGAYIYMFYVMPKTKTKKYREWQNSIIQNTKKHRKKIISNNHIPEPEDDDQYFLVKTWIHEYLNIYTLNDDPTNAIKNVVGQIVEFANKNIILLSELP